MKIEGWVQEYKDNDTGEWKHMGWRGVNFYFWNSERAAQDDIDRSLCEARAMGVFTCEYRVVPATLTINEE